MKTIILTFFLFFLNFSISAQTKNDSIVGRTILLATNYNYNLLLASDYGATGIVLSVASPVWVGLGYAMGSTDFRIYALISIAQNLIGTIYQFYAWRQIRIASIKMGTQRQNDTYNHSTDEIPMNYKTWKLQHPDKYK